MIKLVVTYNLEESVNSDEFWEWYLNEKAPHFATTPGLKRYVLNRVLEPHIGKPPFWGMTEIYFDDMETFNKRHSAAGLGETKEEMQYSNSVMTDHSGFFVDEMVIVGNRGFKELGKPAPESNKYLKLVVTSNLKKGVNSDEYWKWYLQVKAQHFSTSPGLKRYILNRTINSHRGAIPFSRMCEIYFDDMDGFNKSHSTPGLGETKEDIEYSNARITDHSGFFVEELVIVGDPGFK